MARTAGAAGIVWFQFAGDGPLDDLTADEVKSPAARFFTPDQAAALGVIDYQEHHGLGALFAPGADAAFFQFARQHLFVEMRIQCQAAVGRIAIGILQQQGRGAAEQRTGTGVIRRTAIAGQLDQHLGECGSAGARALGRTAIFDRDTGVIQTADIARRERAGEHTQP